MVDAVRALAATDAGPRASAGRDGGEKEIGTVSRRRGKGQRSARTQNAMASAQRGRTLVLRKQHRGFDPVEMPMFGYTK